jgi:succinoglycan biosynthesis transport protein ExoP
MSGFEQQGMIQGASLGQGSPEPLGVPFTRFVGVIRRQGWAILTIVALGLGLTTAIVYRMTPRYTAQVSILIEPRRTQVSDLQAISSEPENAPNIMRTQIDILRSPDLLNGVVRELKLTELPEFAPWKQEPSLVGRAIDEILIAFHLRQPVVTEVNEVSRIQLSGLYLAGKISFSNEARSNVLHLSVETEDGALSAQIANEIARQFLDFKRHQKFAATQRAHEWFQERLGELVIKVRAAEQAVQLFREENGLTEVPTFRNGAQAYASINAQQMVQTNQQLMQLMSDRAQKEAQLQEMNRVLQQGGRVEALPTVVQSSLIQRLRELEVTLAGREAEIAATLGDRSPDLVSVRSQRRGVQRRIQEEMANLTGGLQNEVLTLQTQEQRLRANFAELRGRVSIENLAEVRLHGLLAEAQASRGIYESFLQRATQLANVSGIQEPDAELVSRAASPLSASAPKKGRLLVVAGGLSLVLGLLIAFMLERLRTGIGTPEDMEVWLGFTPVGLVPRVTMRRNRPQLEAPSAMEFTAAMSRIRGNFQVLDPERRPRLVMVTSAMPKEGKSVFSVGMAESAARAGWRVLLIDCDMRRPSIARYLGLPVSAGLDRVLGEASALGDRGMLIHRMPSGLHVMPTEPSSRNPQDLLDSDRMRQLIKWAREEFDLVVLDTPPVLAVADPMILARQVDSVLLAVCAERTPQATVRAAVKLLQGSGVRMLGTVLTQVHMRRMAGRGEGIARAWQSAGSHYGPRA